jgi:hypothetical protein
MENPGVENAWNAEIAVSSSPKGGYPDVWISVSDVESNYLAIFTAHIGLSSIGSTNASFI